MFRSLGLYAYAAVLGLLALGSVGHAQTASPHNQKPDIKADLIVGGVDAKEPQYAWVGVRVALGPGWKTYWKSPGPSPAWPLLQIKTPCLLYLKILHASLS